MVFRKRSAGTQCPDLSGVLYHAVQRSLVPTYINYTTVFHVKDTFFGLLVPSLMMSAFNVLLMKSYFVTGVPDEILEAAYIDGANEFQTMWKIAIPLSKPIITTVAMFSGIAYWNDWNNGYIYLTKRTDLYSIQNLLNRLMQNIQALTQNANNMAQAGEGLSQIPSGTVRMAMAALGILPIMIIYPFIQKNFVKGITLGGVKADKKVSESKKSGFPICKRKAGFF